MRVNTSKLYGFHSLKQHFQTQEGINSVRWLIEYVLFLQEEEGRKDRHAQEHNLAQDLLGIRYEPSNRVEQRGGFRGDRGDRRGGYRGDGGGYVSFPSLLCFISISGFLSVRRFLLPSIVLDFFLVLLKHDVDGIFFVISWSLCIVTVKKKSVSVVDSIFSYQLNFVYQVIRSNPKFTFAFSDREVLSKKPMSIIKSSQIF